MIIIALVAIVAIVIMYTLSLIAKIQYPETPQQDIVKVKLGEKAVMPIRKTKGASGYDLTTIGVEKVGSDVSYSIDRPVYENDIIIIKTGIFLEIKKGYEVVIRPRSSTLKKGLIIYLGTIDSDYTGEIIIAALATKTMKVKIGHSYAQMVIQKTYTPELKVVKALKKTERGEKGFGSTGD